MSKLQLAKEQGLDLFASLSQRDRFLVIILGVSFFFGGIGISIYSMMMSLKAQDAELSTLESNIQLLEIIKIERASVQSEVEEIEQALAQNATTDLSAFLEKSVSFLIWRFKSSSFFCCKKKDFLKPPPAPNSPPRLLDARCLECSLSWRSTSLNRLESSGTLLLITIESVSG